MGGTGADWLGKGLKNAWVGAGVVGRRPAGGSPPDVLAAPRAWCAGRRGDWMVHALYLRGVTRHGPARPAPAQLPREAYNNVRRGGARRAGLVNGQVGGTARLAAPWGGGRVTRCHRSFATQTDCAGRLSLECARGGRCEWNLSRAARVLVIFGPPKLVFSEACRGVCLSLRECKAHVLAVRVHSPSHGCATVAERRLVPLRSIKVDLRKLSLDGW